MKTFLLIGLLFCGVSLIPDAFAQATVKLNNLDRKIPITISNNTSIVIGDDYFVEVLAGPVGGTLLPISIVGTNRTKIKLNKNGYFDGNIGVIPVVDPNESADFQIRIWRGLPTYEMAWRFGLLTGYSEKWTQKTGSLDMASSKNPTGPVLQISTNIYYSGSIGPVPPLSSFCLKEDALTK